MIAPHEALQATETAAPAVVGPGREPQSPTLGHFAEYVALRTVAAGLGLIGIRNAGAVGARLVGLAHSPLGIRRHVVERQVESSLPGRDRAEVARITRESYAHLGRTFTETALLASRSRADILGLVDRVDGWDAVERCLAGGRAAIFVSGHLGNWELAGAYIAARGIRFAAVARHMANPLFDRYLTQTRERIGMHIIHDEA
ncbi:MAG TPA: hypothetical protein VMH39_13315, partial [Gemmatimonadaceae bacterium]|nr:hypothetical protein [Gemmatimonadaceae bacterium]